MRAKLIVLLATILPLGAAAPAAALCPTSPGDPEAVLQSPTPEAGGRFGCALALSGSRLAVGAEGEGRVHVFLRSGDVWSLEQTLEAPPGEPVGSALGRAVDLLGDRLVVTMTRPVAPATGAPRPSAVLVYERGAGGWALAGVIETASDAAGPALDFGRSLDLSARGLAVGAPGGSDPEALSPGWVDVYEHDGASFVPSGRAEPPPAWSNPWTFGGAVAFRFPHLVVAAGELPNRVPGEEPVATYLRQLSGWEFNRFLRPQAFDGDHGTSLDFDSTTLAVGCGQLGAARASSDLWLPNGGDWLALASLEGIFSIGPVSVARDGGVSILGGTTVFSADEPSLQVYERLPSGAHVSESAWDLVALGARRRGDLLPVDLEGLRAAMGTPQAHGGEGRVHLWACQENEAPSCSAVADATTACRAIELTAEAEDPNGDELTFQWSSSDCPMLVFEPHDGAPVVLTRVEGACALSCEVRLEVSDGRGGECADAVTLRFGDDQAPELTGLPADDLVECDAVPPPAPVTASDDCDPLPELAFSERRADGACPQDHELIRTWTARDACGNEASHEQVLRVRDRTPPTLSPPADLEVSCPAPSTGPDSEAAWLASATAEDACGTATVRSRELSRRLGCAATYEAVHEFWAVDECGNESPRVERAYRVIDDAAPALAAPADVVVECPAPESGPGSLAEWIASASASDECGDALVLSELVAHRPGCGATWEEEWEFQARDDCGNESERVRRRYTVVDTTPPVFEPEGDGPLFQRQVWPPDHSYVLFELAELASASDSCGEAVLEISACTSNQPEDSHADQGGDGRTEEDCVWSVDQQRLAVRAERLGACGPGSQRRYEIEVAATDECGNSTSRRGEVVVPHDGRTGTGPASPGSRLGRPPFATIHETHYGAGCDE